MNALRLRLYLEEPELVVQLSRVRRLYSQRVSSARAASSGQRPTVHGWPSRLQCIQNVSPSVPSSRRGARRPSMGGWSYPV